MKKYLLLFVLISSYGFSQSINDYQYVIVPVKFDFLKKEDQYRLNTLTKFLLQKYGFKAYFNNEQIPSNIENQRCNFLYANVLENNGMLMTKVKITLKDCKEKVLFETEYGNSREKEYPVAYNEALRKAGMSFNKLNYVYSGKNVVDSMTVTPVAQTENSVPISSVSSPSDISETFYFAQPTTNGYQIVDTEPKVIMKLFNTSQKTYLWL